MTLTLHSEAPLLGKTAVVLGGTGNVGEGIVRAFVTAGANVVVPSASAARLARLHELVPDRTGRGRLLTLNAGYDSFSAADDLAELVLASDHGAIDHVVASIGGWWQGKALWQVDQNDWNDNFMDVTSTHFAVARAFVPRLSPRGSYSMIAGFSGLTPYPGAGIVSMAGAALLMMRSVLSAELKGEPRVNDLVLGPIVNRSRPKGDPTWLTADDVGTATVHVAVHPEVRDRSIVLDKQEDLSKFVASGADVR